VLFCIKHLDPMQYEHITGLHQSGSLAFAAELKERGIPFWLRYVLIPNLTDRVGDIEMLIAFAKAQPTMRVSTTSVYGAAEVPCLGVAWCGVLGDQHVRMCYSVEKGQQLDVCVMPACNPTVTSQQ
jgi:hypothetical protein